LLERLKDSRKKWIWRASWISKTKSWQRWFKYWSIQKALSFFFKKKKTPFKHQLTQWHYRYNLFIKSNTLPRPIKAMWIMKGTTPCFYFYANILLRIAICLDLDPLNTSPWAEDQPSLNQPRPYQSKAPPHCQSIHQISSARTPKWKQKRLVTMGA
jgi:hypothetical protein